MDGLWSAVPLDSLRDAKVFIHPTASFAEIRRGQATDGVDVTNLVTQGSHSCFDATLSLAWNNELTGAKQPKPDQIIEIQLLQRGVYHPIWLGLIDAVSGYTVQRGERSLQLSAKTRDAYDGFRTTKRQTQLFPQMTDVGYIARKVAVAAGLLEEEVLLPMGTLSTAHTNTQLADMSAWDMITSCLLPMGLTPFMDSVGRLRAARRDIQSAAVDLDLVPERVVKVTASRARPPATRVRVRWRNPVLRKSIQQGRKLAELTATTGWWFPFLHKKMYFSEDRRQRAVNTRLEIVQSANTFKIPVCQEEYVQIAENRGELRLTNLQWTATTTGLILLWLTAHNTPDAIDTTTPGVGGYHTHPVVAVGTGVATSPTTPSIFFTTPTGRRLEGAKMAALMWIFMSIGTGQYEIWGQPYDWIHARNTTEAFNVKTPPWIDTASEIESDFVMNEQHAQTMAVRELIYLSSKANQWSVSIADDPRIEYGDILRFPDGSKMYVEDFRRTITRGDPAQLEVTGFLITGGKIAQATTDPTPPLNRPPMAVPRPTPRV